MKTISQYKADIAALMKKSSDLDAQAIAENRDLTDAEVLLKNEILDTVEDLQRTVTTLDRQERLNALLEKPESPVTVERPNAALSTQVRDKDRFGSFGEQMAAVMRAGLPGGHADPRLLNAATGLNETVPSDGGFLVQTDFAEGLIQQVFETGVLASRVGRRIPISGNANGTKINGMDETSRATGSRYGGVRAYWADEADEKTASKPKFRKIELLLKKLVGLCYATDENLDDAAQLGNIIQGAFVSEFGFQIDDAMINGTGNGMPLGILKSGCLVTQAAETQQDAGTIVAENVINMYARLFASSRASAVWFINQEIEPQLFKMGIAVGVGGQLVYMPPGGLSQSPYGSLFGRPVVPIEQCAALGAVGDIILADFTNGYILADKGSIKSDISIHVRFIYDESVFRFVLRIDGQPVRATVLTPYKGSTTQSHFVALAAR